MMKKNQKSKPTADIMDIAINLIALSTQHRGEMFRAAQEKIAEQEVCPNCEFQFADGFIKNEGDEVLVPAHYCTDQGTGDVEDDYVEGFFLDIKTPCKRSD